MLRFIFILHNHQPIGNFNHVFEQSYQESYLPFLEVFAQYPDVKMALHTSGSLMEWLAGAHPEYLDKLAELVRAGRIEVIGGPFFEAILAMLPSRDRIGQIRMYTKWLKENLGAGVEGMWMPERVWEQSFVRDMVEAGIRYTILDDCHFRSAGLDDTLLYRHYLTEDDGKTMIVFPGSERLRYLIPFREVEDTIRYLGEYSARYPDAVILHGDDGEKFGGWPDTYQTVYKERWLHRFFEALSNNKDWLMTTTPKEAISAVKPLGKIYLPDGSYREMTEWVLPPERHDNLEGLSKEMQNDHRWSRIREFIRGGYWRNFKIRYPETDEMYSRMMSVSNRWAVLDKELNGGGHTEDEPGLDKKRSLLEDARLSLYRGQCNCSYWHGAFGGIYIPHLRNAVYHELIAADNALDALERPYGSWIDAQIGDFNFDSQNEVRLENNRLCAMFAPHIGGTMYELDVKSICHNLLASLTRRPESYHKKVLQKAWAPENELDRIKFKQEGLENRLEYDRYPRKSLIDLFYDYDTNLEAVRSGLVGQHGTFPGAEYEAELRRKPGRFQLFMSSYGTAYGMPIKINKGITFSSGSDTIEIAYKLEGLPQNYKIHFGIELNFAGLPAGADDRYYFDENGDKLGGFGSKLDLHEISRLGLRDEWLGLKIDIEWSEPCHLYGFPIEAVSQSEGGFELVHQSVCLQPHWYIIPDSQGAWSNEFKLKIGT